MRIAKTRVRTALDDLSRHWPAALRKAALGAVLHPASVDGNLVHASEVLHQKDGDLFRLATLFGPQHGYLGQTQDNMIEWRSYRHESWGIPVHSLYGEHREPTQDMLEGLDALLVDLQDVGARYYTFIWTLYLCMKACEKKGIPVLVVDRPNPINGETREGPVLDPGYRSFVGLHPIPVRHGKTIGQLARQFQEEAFPRCEVQVLEMEGYDPSHFFEETGLPWVLPSPNMPTPETALVYPGMCLLEATNISEARGTTKPFELFGAAYLKNPGFAKKLNALGLPGVHFREAYFEPTFHKFKGELCRGAQIHVTDRRTFLPYRTGLEIIRLVYREYPESFRWKQPPYEYEYGKLPIEILIGGPLSGTFADAPESAKAVNGRA